MLAPAVEFRSWQEDVVRGREDRVTRVPLEALDGWRTEPGSGNLVHRSGRFFSVEGLEVRRSGREIDAWRQPIIVQPEQGVLGVLVKEFAGVPHCLLQLKMEPGNSNGYQLSPTVQATRSNFHRVHGGRAVPYLEYFAAPRPGRVLADALQSEQGSWFLAKRNRNIVVQVTEDVPVLPDFRWVDFATLGGLLATPHAVNMDTRTVLSGLVGRRPAAADPGVPPLHTTEELLSWFTEAKSRCELDRSRVPLAEVDGWSYADGVLAHDEGGHFTILGVDVKAGNREVAGWQQPMLAPCGEGVVAFLVRPVRGVPHVLVQARIEGGAFDGVEIAPTVQCRPDPRRPYRPPFLEEVLGADPSRILYDTVQSEEGGRFYHAHNRYLLVDAGEDFPLDVPPDFAWASVRQLAEIVRFGNHLNVEARSLLAFLGFPRPDRT